MRYGSVPHINTYCVYKKELRITRHRGILELHAAVNVFDIRRDATDSSLLQIMKTSRKATLVMASKLISTQWLKK